MAKTNRIALSDLVGYSRLAVAATVGITSLVEAVQRSIVAPPNTNNVAFPGRTTGMTGAIYSSVRELTKVVGGGLDVVLAQTVPMLGQSASSPEREALLAALNGVIGDYLAETRNPLAIPMS